MKNGVILDTDIGYDPDDLFALLLLLNSPELGLDLVVTGDEVQGKRAAFARTVLDQYGRRDLRVVQGEDLGNRNFVVDELIQDCDYSPEKNYLDAMKEVLDAHERVTYIGIQGFSNLANLLRYFPESREKLVVYQMGGAVDYSRRPGWVEHNIKIDVEAARSVLTSGVNISLVMAQTTYKPGHMVDDQHVIYQKLKQSDQPAHQMLACHLELFHEAKGFWSYMHDPLTVAAALGKDFVNFYESAVSMDKLGNLHSSTGSAKLHLSKTESKVEEFMEFLEQRLF